MEEAVEGENHPFAARFIGFVRRRPILSLGLLAGVGVLGGIEWAAGALVGLSAAALVATPGGRELRHELGRRAREMFQPPAHGEHGEQRS
ncbi:MAG TPA: hypothetical protein VGL86_32670 [Polyangia bacterium]